MSDTLRKILDIHFVEDNIKTKNSKDNEGIDIIGAGKKELMNMIEKEILEKNFNIIKQKEQESIDKIELEAEEIKKKKIIEANQEIEKTRIINKIKDLKLLTITGVVLAFLIGFSVNQFTEAFVIVKTSLSLNDNIWFVLFFAIIFAFLSISLVLWLLFRNLDKEIKEKG